MKNVRELSRGRVLPLLLLNAISTETHRHNYIPAGLRRYIAQNSVLWITRGQRSSQRASMELGFNLNHELPAQDILPHRRSQLGMTLPQVKPYGRRRAREEGMYPCSLPSGGARNRRKGRFTMLHTNPVEFLYRNRRLYSNTKTATLQ